MILDQKVGILGSFQLPFQSLMASRYLEWDKRGFFIAPGEAVECYEKRIQALGASEAVTPSILRQVYGVDPSWVRVEYAKKGLYPWEAGCTWYDDVPWIQLHKSFLTSDKRFGIYSKEEVLAHEYVHAVRAPLESSRFEELSAYLLSYYAKKGPLTLFRAFLGPLFDRPWQVITAFVCFLFAPLIGLLFLGCCFARLLYTWRQWFLCKKHLLPITDAPLKLMVRLSDQEIVLFSKLSTKQIAAYIAEQTDFRWTILQQHLLMKYRRALCDRGWGKRKRSQSN